MNTEEKAKAFDEALERFHQFKEKYYSKETHFGDVLFDKTGEMQKDFDSIFPQLAESEDERIIQNLIDAFIEYKKSGGVDFHGIEINTLLAWLEKQKEQKPIEPELKTPEWVCGGWDDEYMINTVIGRYSLHAEVAKKRGDTHDYNLSKSMENWLRNVVKPLIIEKQKENSKSADSISSDYTSDAKYENIWHKVADSLPGNGREVLAKDTLGNLLLARYDGEGWDVSVYDEEDYRCQNSVSMWCEIPSEKQKEQKPAEWSEEDEKMLISIISDFAQGHNSSIGQEQWLKSLPERFSLQPKQEWSEEDEVKLKQCIRIVSGWEGDYDIVKSPYSNFLKSLRPQSKDEIYKEKDEAFKLGKHQLAIKFMNYLDENRPEDKMSLSNSECEDIDKAFKENDWAKIMRYAEKYWPHWKPSEEQMNALKGTIDFAPETFKPICTLATLYEDLKKML